MEGTTPLGDTTIETWLEQLGSAAPAPGGGAAAAMSTAIGAALVGMVANLTIGKPAYAEWDGLATIARDKSTALRADALRLAEEDAAAFNALMATYRLPKSTDAEKAARSAAIQDALVASAQVSVDIAYTAMELIGLAKALPGRSNRSVVSDVAIAAASAAAGLESAIVNVDVNINAIRDHTVKAQLTSKIGGSSAALADARAVVEAVRQGFTA